MSQPENWYEEELQGVACEANIQLLELFEWDLTPMTDKWVEQHFPNSGGVEPLK